MQFIDNIVLIWQNYSGVFFTGVRVTMTLALVGTVIGFLFSLLFGTLRIQEVTKRDSLTVKIVKISLRTFTKIYVTIIRGTPMLVQAVIFYYYFYSIGIRWSPLQAGLFTVSVNTTAYLTEVIRGGIQAVDKGQMEAARSLGLNKAQAMLYVIFPQAIKNSMPAIGNEFIINIKDTAVLSVIGIVELYRSSAIAGSRYSLFWEPALIAAAIYLFLTYTTSKVLLIIEKKMDMKPVEIQSSN